MGSRAVLLLCRDEETAQARFGVPDGLPGAMYTRTGRPFFAPGRTPAGERAGPAHAAAADAVRAGIGLAGLWDELATGWLLLDCELMPWSVKAGDLLRHQYAASAPPHGPAARGAPACSPRRPAGWGGGRARPRTGPRRQRRGVHRRLPALLLAGGRPGRRAAGAVPAARHRGRTSTTTDHPWHLSLADRLAAAAPELYLTRRAGGRGRPGGRGGRDRLVGGAGRGRRRGHGGEAARQPDPFTGPGGRGLAQPGSRSGAGSTCGSSTAPTTPSRRTWPGCGNAIWAGSVRWRCGSTPWASRHWTGARRGAAVAGPRGRLRRAGPGVRAGRPPSLGRGRGRRVMVLVAESLGLLTCLVRGGEERGGGGGRGGGR